MSVDFSDVGALVTREGESFASAWRIESYCACPTVTIKNLETGETQHFGIRGLMADGWVRLLPETSK